MRDLKSRGLKARAGSTPAPGTQNKILIKGIRVISLLAGHETPTLEEWVRFPYHPQKWVLDIKLC